MPLSRTLCAAAVALFAIAAGHAVPAASSRRAPARAAAAPPHRAEAPVRDAAATAPSPAPQPRSKRNANYSIDVELDPGSRTLVGRQVLTWRNITANPTSELRFHLYYNAWKNSRSTWLREAARAPRDTGIDRLTADDWGWIDVSAVRLLGASAAAPFTDLTPTERFLAPDDANVDDRTLMAVSLPHAVAPGEAIAVEIAWTAHVPRPFDRTGGLGPFYFLAQWFPAIGVLQDTGWNAHQFHATTEFFGDYGMYDVRITVPAGWIVGATGVEQAPVAVPNGKVVHRFVEEDVHDFAWTASPRFVEHRGRFEHAGLPPVDIRLLLQPEHASQAAAHLDAAATALLFYGQWFGPYPYGHLTIVDPAWRSKAGGMEYPTLVTAGTRWLMPPTAPEPAGVVLHEVGHQFFYGLVGTNEVEDAWMDEGVNTFVEGRVGARAYPASPVVERYFGGFLPWVYPDVRRDRVVGGDRIDQYRRAAANDALTTPAWRFDAATANGLSYAKTALWLHTLEGLVGWPRLQRGLALYVTRSLYGHPGPHDFFSALSEGAGTDLRWFFDQVYRGSSVLDYGVRRLSSRPIAVRGYVGDDGRRRYAEGAPERPVRFETELEVRRYGEMILPVDVLVTFADGTHARERWDGRDRQRIYRFVGPARAVRAEIDPNRVLVLDLDETNNTWTADARAHAAAVKWSAKWLVWLQDAVLTWTSLV